jgi:UDP-N-acetylmuramate--alanine ligase
MDRTGTGIAPVGKEPHQAHLVGLDGRGMSGLAQMLVQRGFVVTGSNPTPSPNTERLKRLGVRVHAGHSPRSVPRSARLLVYSSEIPREHPDRLSALRTGIEQTSCPEMLARLLGRGIGVAATGGRKAGLAAAMVGWTLTHAGLDPTIVLGAGLPQLGGSGRLGLGPHVIVEAGDVPIEADLPGAEIVLIHDESRVHDRSTVLRRWVEAAPPGGYILGFADEGEVFDIPRSSLAEVERFSLAPGHDWWGADLREDRGRYRFRAFHRGRFALEVRLQVPGRHHVLGALAAVAVCGRVDLTSRAIKEGLEEFEGVSRGFESRGSYRGVTLVDDEALGPLAVGEALAVAREVFGRRRLHAAYRPSKGSSDSSPLPSEFVEADRVWVIDEEGPSAGSIARALVEALVEAGSVARRASGLEEAIQELDRHLEPGDVLVTLGAGDVGTIADAFLRRLSSDRHAR